MSKLRASRAKRILDMASTARDSDCSPKIRKKDPLYGNNKCCDSELRRSSPIPESVEQELIELEDLIGDEVFKTDFFVDNEIIRTSPLAIQSPSSISQSVLTLNSPSKLTSASKPMDMNNNTTPVPSPALEPMDNNINISPVPSSALEPMENSIKTTPVPSPALEPMDNNINISLVPSSALEPMDNGINTTPVPSPALEPMDNNINISPVPSSALEPMDNGINTTPVPSSALEPMNKNSNTSPVPSALEPMDNCINTTPCPSPLPHQEGSQCNDTFCPVCQDTMPNLSLNDLYGNLPTPVQSPASSNVTPSSSKLSRKKTYKQDIGKKRLIHKEQWTVTQRKALKNTGKSFSNKKGIVIPEKKIKGPCKCRQRCKEKITEEERLKVFNKFWSLGDRSKQWLYVIKYTQKAPKKRSTTNQTKHDRQNTYNYYLPDKNHEKILVCKVMFLNTIASGERIVPTAWKKFDGDADVEPDRRGQYDHKPRVIDDDMIKSVSDHVISFKPVESHYLREQTTKLYIEGINSMSRMFKLYCEWYDPTKYSKKATTKRQYTDIVGKYFNIGFFKPKKDLCDICHTFENNTFPTENEKELQIQHLTRKKIARKLKKADKKEAKSNSSVMAATFDFEKVLISPHGEVSVFYYKRKLSTYNFTVYDLATKKAVCYMWYEGVAKRGSNEVSSCLYKYIKDNVAKGKTDFRFWSDNCTGQNRNRIVFSLYLYAAKEFGVTITHRFLEKGHTQNEGDSVHSTVEKASLRKLIYVPEEWYCLVRWAKVEGESYEVDEIQGREVYDFKSLLEDKNWAKNISNEKVQWTKIREVHVKPNNPGLLLYKYDFNDPHEAIMVIKDPVTTRNTRPPPLALVNAYEGPLPISYDKYKDLNDLCKNGIIPERYHEFYKDLHYTRTNKKKDQSQSITIAAADE